ncbi:protein O-mannosyl-transferase TMTC3-like isoform X3 [Biomphalaria glabrata]|uniref:dolichyl-phosphate-mannose--protein mannosyltransferase n=1 Tax=Biomphalaria glabrata TaxID=6526 RepID=A0A9W3AR89_BIOGL|nr:protein O-mannosyl-transferase TMTC3-like isoform X3 [Biomphalaria glabrata]
MARRKRKGDKMHPCLTPASMMENFAKLSFILCAVVATIYHNALWCGFVFDDMSAIVENKDLRPNTPFSDLFLNDFWGTPMHKEKSHKSYRPLCVATFRLNYALSELEPLGYHLLNILLHSAVCIIFMRVCLMFMSEATSFASALLFAVHPIHTEAVTGVVGRAETLSSIFFLGAFIFYSKSTGYREKTKWVELLTTVFLVTVAMLCKEQGITVVGVCCVYEIFIVQRCTLQELLIILRGMFGKKPSFPQWLITSLARAGFLVFSTTFLLFARIKVMGAQLPVFTNFDNPASTSPTPARQLTFNYLLSVNAWLLLKPSNLCCDWTMGTIKVISSFFDLRNLCTLIFYAVLVILCIFAVTQQTQRSRTVLMSLALIVLPFIPASNLFFPVGFVVAERILYTPSFGFCMLVAFGAQVLKEKFSSRNCFINVALAFLIVAYGVKTYLRNFDWESEYTIFRSGLKVNQENAKLFNNVGHALEKLLKFDEALHYFEKAASVQPDDIGAHINVGRTYVQLNKSQPAELSYLKAISLFPPIIKGKSYQARVAPSHLNAYLNLANLISKDPNRLREADQLLRQAITMRSDFVEAYINLGDIQVKLGKLDDARATYEAALKQDPTNADLYYNLGVVLLELNQTKIARAHFERALQYNPDHWQSLYNSAILMQEGGDPKERNLAFKRLERLKVQKGEDPKVYFNYAMLAMDEYKFEIAEQNFKKAIELDPTFRSALFNLALMLVNNLNRPYDAIPILNQLLEQYPDHDKGLILMGDINVNTLKDLDAAEKNFNSILSRNPRNSQAMHNLCVVYVERGDLLQAEKCLQQTQELDPTAEYIQNHLRIVRNKISEVRSRMTADKKYGQQPMNQPFENLKDEKNKLSNQVSPPSDKTNTR